MIITVIMVMKRGDRNKTQAEQVMHNTVAHCSLTSAQPVPKQPLRQLSLFIYMTFHGMEFPFGEFGSAVTALLPPSFLCSSPLAEQENVLDLW